MDSHMDRIEKAAIAIFANLIRADDLGLSSDDVLRRWSRAAEAAREQFRRDARAAFEVFSR